MVIAVVRHQVKVKKNTVRLNKIDIDVSWVRLDLRQWDYL